MAINPEDLQFDYNRLQPRLEDAHDLLDDWGVPRGNGDSTLTIKGRLEWLNQMIPDLWDQVRKAKETL